MYCLRHIYRLKNENFNFCFIFISQNILMINLFPLYHNLREQKEKQLLFCVEHSIPKKQIKYFIFAY